jgi:hypothetical protein
MKKRLVFLLTTALVSGAILAGETKLYLASSVFSLYQTIASMIFDTTDMFDSPIPSFSKRETAMTARRDKYFLISRRGGVILSIPAYYKFIRKSFHTFCGNTASRSAFVASFHNIFSYSFLNSSPSAEVRFDPLAADFDVFENPDTYSSAVICKRGMTRAATASRFGGIDAKAWNRACRLPKTGRQTGRCLYINILSMI